MHFKRIHANQEETIISARNMKFIVWICPVFTKEIHIAEQASGIHVCLGGQRLNIAETAEQRKTFRLVPSGNGAVRRRGDAAPEAGH